MLLRHLLHLSQLAALAAAAAAANALFDDQCPDVDRRQRVGADLVVDVVEDFYRDLVFVRAATDERRGRDYAELLAELGEPAAGPLAHLQCELLRRLDAVGAELQRDRPAEALSRCEAVDKELRALNPVDLRRDEIAQAQSYLHYLRADAHRLLGDHARAMDQIAEATRLRQRAPGVPLNELERLNGLVVVGRVAAYNAELDQMFGLASGPNMTLLAARFARLKHSAEPLAERRAASYRRQDQPAALSGHSVAASALRAILCEFAQKLAATGASSADRPPSGQSPAADYGAVLAEIRHMDPQFVADLKGKVAAQVVLGRPEAAAREADALTGKIWDFDCWTLLEPSSGSSAEGGGGGGLYANRGLREMEAYAKYFQAEAHRRSPDGPDSLARSEAALGRVKRLRKAQRGVSMGRLAELEGRVVFKALLCLHRRVRALYKLDGREGPRELDAKRARYGASRTALAAA